MELHSNTKKWSDYCWWKKNLQEYPSNNYLNYQSSLIDLYLMIYLHD